MTILVKLEALSTSRFSATMASVSVLTKRRCDRHRDISGHDGLRVLGAVLMTFREIQLVLRSFWY